MTSTAKPISPETTRELDPNVVQRRAADPETSSWVSASAGTGKTKVLTDRVLRLLLPRENGAPASPAAKILCLTFTKAAASEMALRLSQTLAKWAVCPETQLTESLQQLLGRPPTPEDFKAARKLFAETTDVPGGLKIMTIHSFCQSILGRFPLEAGIAPGFIPLEEHTARTLMNEAKAKTITTIKTATGNPALSQALSHVASQINEEQFETLLRNITGERRQLRQILSENFGIEGVYTALCQLLNIQAGKTTDEILREALQDQALDKENLLSAAQALLKGTEKTDQPRGADIADFLAKNVQTRTDTYLDYIKLFLTDGKARARLATNTVTKNNPKTLDTLQTEAERLLALEETLKATKCTALTRDLITLTQEIINTYTALKARQNALDFDDLIIKTLDLLENKGGASWVLYKLDQGIDHILIDEAQDTNPEQWQIIRALCDEFFAGEAAAADDINRTLFTVGDEKQSIYSFQRASPEKFGDMHAYFKEKITAANKKWADVPINISFRSTKSVLEAVDATFNIPALRAGVSHTQVQHIPAHNRSHQEGIVELWPLCEPDEKTEPDTDMPFWEPPTTIIEQKSGASKLCDQIASQIETWLKTGEQLASHGRAIKPGDIMILVRTRGQLTAQIARSLKNKNIPVGGADRLVLGNEIIIQDLLTIIEFALLPGDDLTLACILKSPLIGLSEDDLFTLAHGRTASLWQALQNSTHTQITTYLQSIKQHALTLQPYDFLNSILYSPCPASAKNGMQAITNRLGEDAIDPILELLSLALKFEKENGTHLQQFVQQIRNQTHEIKREQEEAGNHVRIMTIHGSKGLQAPIVIMPDTIRSGSSSAAKADSKILWPDKTNLPLPLWTPRKEMECAIFKDAAQIIKQRAEEEYRRLLYVAMTRAEDRLYICGGVGKTKPQDESWYFYIKQGLEAANAKTLENGALQLHNTQIRDPDRTDKSIANNTTEQPLPDWIFQAAPNEPNPPRPLTPSRPSQSEPAAISPLKSNTEHRFRRGNITHKLLEILPNLPAQSHNQAAAEFLTRNAADLPEKTQQSIKQQIKTILTHPDFAPIFGANSQAEVPITGLMPDGRIISGQIDRLLITDEEILIIDYKTGKPPEKPEDIPQIYRNQLKAYRDTLTQIYPTHTIKCALLWTDTANLMPVTFEE